jgi:hypothetical protein
MKKNLLAVVLVLAVISLTSGCCIKCTYSIDYYIEQHDQQDDDATSNQ